MSLSSKNILIGVSGSISAYKVCEVISYLKKQNCDVKVIATDSALQFVGKATFEGLTGHPVLSTDFQDGAMMSHRQFAGPTTRSSRRFEAPQRGAGPAVGPRPCRRRTRQSCGAPLMAELMGARATLQWHCRMSVFHPYRTLAA